jgi:hypothetical protein
MMDKETLERVNTPIEFREYPKMKHHPDGRTQIVENDREESELGPEWLPSPDAANKVRAERDAGAEKSAAIQRSKGPKVEQ